MSNASPDGWTRLAEVEAWGSGTANIHWLVSDQLGTPRMIADQTGSLSGISRHDYLPFGEELNAGIGLRSAVEGFKQPRPDLIRVERPDLLPLLPWAQTARAN